MQLFDVDSSGRLRSTGPPLQFLIPTDLTVLASRLKSLRHAKFQYF
jgi:hypothetical protein